MSDKLTSKQEAFVIAYVESKCSASDAYRSAYNHKDMSDECIHVEACRLLQNPKVAQRLKFLREAVAERAILDANAILDELLEARTLALRLEQPSAMVAASMGRAKVAGLIVERSEQGKPGEFESMNAAQLRDFIASETETLGGGNRTAKAPRGNGAARKQLQ